MSYKLSNCAGTAILYSLLFIFAATIVFIFMIPSYLVFLLVSFITTYKSLVLVFSIGFAFVHFAGLIVLVTSSSIGIRIPFQRCHVVPLLPELSPEQLRHVGRCTSFVIHV